jgi:hypothetical protein
MADQPAQPDTGKWQPVIHGAIPRMDLNIPVPPGTKPPPAPTSQTPPESQKPAT